MSVQPAVIICLRSVQVFNAAEPVATFELGSLKPNPVTDRRRRHRRISLPLFLLRSASV